MLKFSFSFLSNQHSIQPILDIKDNSICFNLNIKILLNVIFIFDSYKFFVN